MNETCFEQKAAKMKLTGDWGRDTNEEQHEQVGVKISCNCEES